VLNAGGYTARDYRVRTVYKIVHISKLSVNKPQFHRIITRSSHCITEYETDPSQP